MPRYLERKLERKIKEDSNGLFVYYGGYRLRPFNVKNTFFKKDQVVLMIKEKNYFRPVVMKIFEEEKKYSELWASKFVKGPDGNRNFYRYRYFS